MSAELVWALVKNNNAFLVKRNNVEFSREPGNLTNLNSFKYSGLANNKTVDITAAPRGIKVTTKRPKNAQKPAQSTTSVVLAHGRRKTALSVANMVARTGYRRDLHKAALARASAIINSQQPKKVRARPAGKGLRAQKKAAAAKQA